MKTKANEILIVTNSGYLGDGRPVIREVNDNAADVEPLFPAGVINKTDEKEVNVNQSSGESVPPLYPNGITFEKK